MMTLNRSAVAAFLLMAGASAFSPPQSFGTRYYSSSQAVSHSSNPVLVGRAPRLMAERATTGSAEEQCAPEEGEYCIVDDSTGKLIKLTVAEKERIFLDALQVRGVVYLCVVVCC